MKTKKNLFCFILIAVLLSSVPGLAVNLISMNFAENTNQVFAGGQLIGPLKTDSTYWNNTGANVPTGTMYNLMDKYGVPTSAYVSWESKNTWYNGDGTGSDEAKLAVGYLDDGDDGPSFTVTSIPFSNYNAYILITSDQNGDYTHGSLTVNGTVVLGGPFPAHGRVMDGTGWVECNGTVYGNYVKVTDLSGNLTVSTVADAGRAPLTAFIIEEIPNSVYVENFSPATGATRVGQDVQLSWEVFKPTGTPSFDVYLSTNPDEVDPNAATVPVASITDTFFTPASPLDPGTLYYWRIDVADDVNTVPITGNVMMFTTGGDVTDLYPADGTTGVATDLTITWTGDAEGSTYIDQYAVYFGQTLPATPTATVTEAQWQASELLDSTAYQCKVVSLHLGTPVDEATVSFTTGAIVGYWPFDDNLTDMVGSNDGTRDNPHFAGGVIGSGSAADFYGGEPITIAIPDAATGGNWAISLWDYSDPTAGGSGIWETILGNGAGPDGWEVFEFGRVNGYRYVFGSGSNYQYTPNDSSYLRGGWQSHALSYDSTAKVLIWYINGEKVKEYTSLTITLHDALSVGNVNGGSQPFTGKVDDLKVYNRPLSDAQVLQAFIDDLAGKPYNPSPAVGTENMFWDPVLEWRFAETPDSAVIEIGTKLDLSDATPVALTGDLTSFNVYAGLGIHLTPSTGYYWRVTPTYSGTPVVGPTWFFVVRDLLPDLNDDLAVNDGDLVQLAGKWLEDTSDYLTEPWFYLDQDYWSSTGGDPNVFNYALPWAGGDGTWAVGTVALTSATPYLNTDPNLIYDPNDQTLLWSYDTSHDGWAVGITLTLPQTIDFSEFDKFGYWVYQRNCTSSADIRIDDENGNGIYRDWYNMSGFNDQWHKYEWDIPAGAATAVYQIRFYRGTINASLPSSEEFGDFFLVKDDQTVKICLPENLTNIEDLNLDCKINLFDLSMMAQDWLLDAGN